MSITEYIEKEISKANYDIKKRIRKMKTQKPQRNTKRITLEQLLAMSNEELNKMSR